MLAISHSFAICHYVRQNALAMISTKRYERPRVSQRLIVLRQKGETSDEEIYTLEKCIWKIRVMAGQRNNCQCYSIKSEALIWSCVSHYGCATAAHGELFTMQKRWPMARPPLERLVLTWAWNDDARSRQRGVKNVMPGSPLTFHISFQEPMTMGRLMPAHARR